MSRREWKIIAAFVIVVTHHVGPLPLRCGPAVHHAGGRASIRSRNF